MFTELKTSLPCLLEPATGPSPEPDESNPHSHTHYFDIFNISFSELLVCATVAKTGS
jgi:hypothetical protein